MLMQAVLLRFSWRCALPEAPKVVAGTVGVVQMQVPGVGGDGCGLLAEVLCEGVRSVPSPRDCGPWALCTVERQVARVGKVVLLALQLLQVALVVEVVLLAGLIFWPESTATLSLCLQTCHDSLQPPPASAQRCPPPSASGAWSGLGRQARFARKEGVLHGVGRGAMVVARGTAEWRRVLVCAATYWEGGATVWGGRGRRAFCAMALWDEGGRVKSG